MALNSLPARDKGYTTLDWQIVYKVGQISNGTVIILFTTEYTIRAFFLGSAR
jgi:hypothetical protein